MSYKNCSASERHSLFQTLRQSSWIERSKITHQRWRAGQQEEGMTTKSWLFLSWRGFWFQICHGLRVTVCRYAYFVGQYFWTKRNYEHSFVTNYQTTAVKNCDKGKVCGQFPGVTNLFKMTPFRSQIGILMRTTATERECMGIYWLLFHESLSCTHINSFLVLFERTACSLKKSFFFLFVWTIFGFLFQFATRMQRKHFGRVSGEGRWDETHFETHATLDLSILLTKNREDIDFITFSKTSRLERNKYEWTCAWGFNITAFWVFTPGWKIFWKLTARVHVLLSGTDSGTHFVHLISGSNEAAGIFGNQLCFCWSDLMPAPLHHGRKNRSTLFGFWYKTTKLLSWKAKNYKFYKFMFWT